MAERNGDGMTRTVTICAGKHERSVSFCPAAPRDGGTTPEELQRTVAAALGLPLQFPFPFVLRAPDGSVCAFSGASLVDGTRYTLVSGPATRKTTFWQKRPEQNILPTYGGIARSLVITSALALLIVILTSWMRASLPSRDAVLSLGLLTGGLYLFPALGSVRVLVDFIATMATITLIACRGLDSAILKFFKVISSINSYVYSKVTSRRG